MMKWTLGLLLLLWAVAGLAEDAMRPQDMIDALKPRTRSLRNLAIRQAEPVAAEASKPVSEPLPTEVPTALSSPPVAAPAEPAPSLSMSINFEFNSARIDASSEKLLGNLATALISDELKTSRFRVEGHTDAKGSVAYNQRLSQQRAQEVKRFLVAHGVAEARLVAAGFGSSQLTNSLDPFAAENRRVRIVTLD